MKKKGANKKLIFIVVGILIAIGLILGLIFLSLSGQKATPDPVSEQCKFACDSEQKNLFCSWEMKTEDGFTATCKTLAENSQYSKYSVEKCSTIKC